MGFHSLYIYSVGWWIGSLPVTVCVCVAIHPKHNTHIPHKHTALPVPTFLNSTSVTEAVYLTAHGGVRLGGGERK